MNTSREIFPDLVEPGLKLHWQMATTERFALSHILLHLKPRLSLEVGTYQGGSLQVLAKYSDKVLSIDIDPKVAISLRSSWPNVDFRSGDSATILPSAVREVNDTGAPLEFVLIDGDHTSEGVRRDIHSLLLLKPTRRVVVLLHDSFNPGCRHGMKTAAWADCPYVHHVELDYIPGYYHQKAHDTAEAKSMWAGFACAILEPEPREGELRIREQQEGLFRVVQHTSRHTTSLARRILNRLSGI